MGSTKSSPLMDTPLPKCDAMRCKQRLARPPVAPPALRLRSRTEPAAKPDLEATACLASKLVSALNQTWQPEGRASDNMEMETPF